CSCADHPAILAADYHHRRTGPATGLTVRKSRAARLARMLDTDEHRPVIRRKGHTGDFTTHRAHQETADFTGRGVSAKHLVVAHTGIVAAVAVLAIGLHPEPAASVEAHPIRAIEHIFGIDVGRAGIGRTSMHHRVAGDDE